MIDLHCHVLPGIDDGPDEISRSLEMARAMVLSGTTTLVATPHVNWHYPNDPDTIEARVGELADRLHREEVPLKVLAGAEIALTSIRDIEPARLSRLTLGDGPWILLEFPFSPTSGGLEGIVAEIQDRGYRILLAHPERCPSFHRDPQMLRSLVDDGALTSITAGSLVGRFGTQARRFALDLFAAGLAHNVASDAHDLVRRPAGIATELREAGLDSIAHWLTDEVPSAILRGDAVPPRPDISLPEPSRRRSGRWRRISRGR